MSEWDFLWESEGDELMEVMSTGMTDADYVYLEEQERKERRKAWMDLKKLRDTGMISKEDFKKRKAEIFE